MFAGLSPLAVAASTPPVAGGGAPVDPDLFPDPTVAVEANYSFTNPDVISFLNPGIGFNDPGEEGGGCFFAAAAAAALGALTTGVDYVVTLTISGFVTGAPIFSIRGGFATFDNIIGNGAFQKTVTAGADPDSLIGQGGPTVLNITHISVVAA